MRRPAALVLLFVVCSFPSVTFGDTTNPISVAFNSPNNFGPSPTISGPDPASSAANPLLGAANVWNNLNVPFGTLDVDPAWNNLVDSTGAATNVDFSVTGNVAGLDMNPFIQNLNPLRSEAMTWNNTGNGSLPNISSIIDWSLTGLAPNTTFDMCVYGMWTNYNRSFNMTIQGTTQNVPSFDATASTPTPDCILFTNLKSDASGTISGVGTGFGAFSNTDEADWAGFQIVPVPAPEPSTLILLGVGALSFLGRIRRKLSSLTSFSFLGRRTMNIKNVMRLRYLLAATCLLLMSMTLHANGITPGETVAPDVYTISTLPPILDSVSGTFNVDGGALVGLYVEGVVVDPLGVTCAGCLDFFVDLAVSSSSTDLVHRVGLNSFKGTVTDVGYVSGTGSVSPTSVLWAPNGTTLSFLLGSFPGIDLDGESTDVMVVATDATAYKVGGSLGIGGFSSNTDSYNNGLALIQGMILPVATPEPSTIYFLGISLLGLTAMTWRLKRLA